MADPSGSHSWKADGQRVDEEQGFSAVTERPPHKALIGYQGANGDFMVEKSGHMIKIDMPKWCQVLTSCALCCDALSQSQLPSGAFLPEQRNQSLVMRKYPTDLG